MIPNATGLFEDWKVNVDRIMLDRFAIDTVAAGLDDTRLRAHFHSGQSASNFVEWYSEKYDLVDRSIADFIPAL